MKKAYKVLLDEVRRGVGVAQLSAIDNEDAMTALRYSLEMLTALESVLNHGAD